MEELSISFITMLLSVLVTCFFVSKYFSHNLLFSCLSEIRLSSLAFRKVSSLFSSLSGVIFSSSMLWWSDGRFSAGNKMEMSMLDLPELVIGCILEKLPTDMLCNMASVCSSLREWCMIERLCEKRMHTKWGRIIGPVAHKEWEFFVAATNTHRKAEERKRKEFLRYLNFLPPVLRVWSESRKERKLLQVDSIMSLCLALDSGYFCFSAQVYNRENGNTEFMLSCYDAKLIYDSRTDTFQARYLPHGTRGAAIENEVPWERIREQIVETTYPYEVHISDCLDEVSPGDHIEIQWRKHEDFPYGWWYGVVGHLESSCYGNENLCSCRNSDMVALEFNQYSIHSGRRRIVINRTRVGHNETTDGFYGGVRKLDSHQQILTWNRFWPTQVLIQ